MIRLNLRLPYLLIATALSSCAYPPQVIQLNPTPPALTAASAAKTGNRDVFLVTRDARASQEIGRRAMDSSQNSAITTDTDIAGLLRTQMTDILKAKGFRVVTTASSETPTLE